MQTISKSKLSWIEALRGVACLAVFFHHAFYSILNSNNSDNISKFVVNSVIMHFDLGVFGVFLFFMISGFVIILSIQHLNTTPSKFATHRIFRIYPMYLTSIVFAAFVYELSVVDLLANAIMFPKVFGSSEAIGVYWSLQVETLFYLVVFLSLFAKNALNTKSLTLLVLSFLALTVLLSYIRSKHSSMPTTPALSLAVLFIGSLYYKLLERWQNSGSKITYNIVSRYYKLSALIVLTFIVAYLSRISKYEDGIVYTFSIIFSITAFILFSVVQFDDKKLYARILMFIGKISFSIYLLHLPIIHILETYTFFIESPSIVQLLTMLLLTIILSWFSYHSVELRFIKLYKKGK